MVAPAVPLSPLEAIAVLENAGYIAPKCRECGDTYRDAVHVAAQMADPTWRPASSHTPSLFCEAGGRNHCTCPACTEKPLEVAR